MTSRSMERLQYGKSLSELTPSDFNLEASLCPLTEIPIEDPIKAAIATLEARKRNPHLQAIWQAIMAARLEDVMIFQLGLNPTLLNTPHLLL